MFYIVQNENLVLFDDDKQKIETTLEFMPQLKSERLLETDIVTEEELNQYPNKVMIDDIEIEIEVPDYEVTVEEYEEVVYETELVEEEYEVIVYDEEGNPVLDEEGNFTYETKTRMVEKQIMEEVEETIIVPVYDENGNLVEEREKLIIKIVPKSHTEIKTKETKTIIGYHTETITVKGLVLNPNFDLEQTEARKEEFTKQFFKIESYGYFRKQPKGYGSAVESLNTAFNVVTILGKLPKNTLTFYKEPDFSIAEQCTEEWLVENSTKNKEMTTEEFGTFYAQFMTAWNTQEHK